MKVKCDIYRFDPDSDAKGRYETYVLDAEPAETVLGILLKIYRYLQPTLGFRFACGVVKCGECSVSVNNTPCLACERVIEPEMKIDPLPNLPLIKDLVIDRRKAFEHIFKLLPRTAGLRKVRRGLRSVKSDMADRYVQLTRCFECLICQSACPVLPGMREKFVGPLGLLWLAQMSLDPRNEAIIQKAVESALEMCQRCSVCSDVCPSSQDILKSALDTLEKG